MARDHDTNADHIQAAITAAGEHVEAVLEFAAERGGCEHVTAITLAMALGHLCHATELPVHALVGMVLQAYQRSVDLEREGAADNDAAPAPVVKVVRLRRGEPSN